MSHRREASRPWHHAAVLVSPLPGADRDNVREALRQLHVKVSNLRSGPTTGGSYRWLADYLGWANEAARMLRSQVRPRDINHLVLTKRYELLLSMVAPVSRAADSSIARVYSSAEYTAVGPVSEPIVNDLLATEIEERTAAFGEAHIDLSKLIERWSRPGVFAVLDTSVYVTHPDKLENLDVAATLDVRCEDIHVLVPVVVVEELDGLKQRGDKHCRWRAAYTLGYLDKVLTNPTAPARLRADELTAHQEISVELLLDPARHIRLPVNDDEIIDRTLAAQSLAGRPVTLVTCDTSQSFKARAAGLRARRLALPIEHEPEPDPSGRTRRQDRGEHARGH